MLRLVVPGHFASGKKSCVKPLMTTSSMYRSFRGEMWLVLDTKLLSTCPSRSTETCTLVHFTDNGMNLRQPRCNFILRFITLANLCLVVLHSNNCNVKWHLIGTRYDDGYTTVDQVEFQIAQDSHERVLWVVVDDQDIRDGIRTFVPAFQTIKSNTEIKVPFLHPRFHELQRFDDLVVPQTAKIRQRDVHRQLRLDDQVCFCWGKRWLKPLR